MITFLDSCLLKKSQNSPLGSLQYVWAPELSSGQSQAYLNSRTLPWVVSWPPELYLWWLLAHLIFRILPLVVSSTLHLQNSPMGSPLASKTLPLMVSSTFDFQNPPGVVFWPPELFPGQSLAQLASRTLPGCSPAHLISRPHSFSKKKRDPWPVAKVSAKKSKKEVRSSGQTPPESHLQKEF